MGSRPGLHKITLYLETDDVDSVERIATAIARIACPVEDFETHKCAVPWFVISSEVESDLTEVVRDLLNR